ncbi:transcriptional regulator [Methanosarcina hadiensis]|uniref:transcriptional regulator n=1 Tax=Methanosarcina hadiensis TaxID=3078083 RepID=UPI003977C6B1
MYKKNLLLDQITCAHNKEGDDEMVFTYVDTEYAPERCSLCNGTGHAEDKICQTCGGQGNVLVAQPAIICPLCNGSGNLETGTCRACGGSGWALF